MGEAHELTQKIKRKAIELGFERVGVTTADPIEGYEEELCRRRGYDLWNVGDPDSKLRLAARPREKVPGVKSVISLVRAVGRIDYPEELLEHLGRIYLSRSYLPPDDTLEGKRVLLFEEYLESLGVRSLYDHTNMQLVDRAIAARAGLVTYGRNNFAYADELGSFIIFVTIPVDVELECEVHEPRRGCPEGCRKCIDACPTGALTLSSTPTSFNANLCLSYQTIENRNDIPEDIARKMGNSIYGCDRCLQVCPWNSFAHPTDEPALQPKDELLQMTKEKWKNLTEEDYRRLFKGSAVKRAKYSGLIRNIKAINDHETDS